MVHPESVAERDRLLLMARKLYRFMLPLTVIALASGVWLWLGWGFGGGWMHAKLALVAVLLVYHHACGLLLARFERNANRRSHIWFRWFNEIPVLLLVTIVVLVVIKPF
jgi:putative membrane protein